MVINLIVFTLMVLNIIEAGDFCFDGTIGKIWVTLTMDPHVSWSWTNWVLKWNDCNWSNIARTRKGSVGISTGPGCCSSGFFRLSGRRGSLNLIGRFQFPLETRLLCDSGIAHCALPATVTKPDRSFIVSGQLSCDCVHDYNTEVTGVSREDFEANSTDAQIENLIVREFDHNFN